MTHTELTAALASLLNRDDLTNQIPLFIEQAESGFSATPSDGGIRHWRGQKRAEVTVSAGEQYLSVPTGYIETIRLHNQSKGMRMTLLSREAMQEERDKTNDQPGDPCFYRHGSNGTIALYPTPAEETVIEMEYHAKPSRLNKQDYAEASPVTENWVSKWYPDAYIYGAALHSAPFLHDDARIATWGGLYAVAVSRINGESRAAQASTSSPRLRNRGMRTSRVPA